MEEIFAHRFVLTMSSTIFDTMFNGPTPIQGDTIEIPDCAPGVFRLFLE